MAETFKTLLGQTTDGAETFINPLIAPDFAETAAYEAGSYCCYQGQVYCFTSEHAAGAWTGTDAVSVWFANNTITTAQIDALFT